MIIFIIAGIRKKSANNATSIALAVKTPKYVLLGTVSNVANNSDVNVNLNGTIVPSIYNATTGTLTSTSSYVTITNTTFNLGALGAATNATAIFEVEISPNTPFGEPLDFVYLLEDGAYSQTSNFTEVASDFGEV